MKLKNALAIGLCLSFINPLMAVKYERNLEDFGFSSEVEKFRRRISVDFDQNLPSTSSNSSSAIPNPVLPKLQSNYSDLVPPPTKPKARRYFQPRLRDNVPRTRDEFTRDRRKRLRDYKRPPDFNLFLQNHRNIPGQVFGNTDKGLTGLYRTVGATTMPKASYLFYSQFSFMRFDRAFGERVNTGHIDKFLVPMGLSAALTDEFEIALSGDIVNEQAINFPLINDYEKTELEELNFMGKYKFFDNPSQQTMGAFGFGVSSAMGKQVTRRATDGTSYLGFLSASKLTEKVNVHGQIGVNIASGKGATGNEHPNNLFYNIGFEIPVATRTRTILEVNGLDWAGYGNNLDLTVGARYQVRDEFSLQFAMPINVLRSNFPQDYSRMFSLGLTLKL